MNQLNYKKLIDTFVKIVGIDFHVLHTIFYRSWGVIAGGVTVLIIPFGLSPTMQGYYYAFASILALQIFFELGLNQVIMQLVSREAAHIKFEEEGLLIGSIDKLDHLYGLVVFIRRWYLVAAIVFALSVGICGWMFFSFQNNAEPINEWLPAWFLLVGLTSVNLYLSPKLAIVEGTGAVGEVARLRLHQSIIGNILLWTLLLNGADLWAVISIPLVSTIVTPIWLSKKAPWLSTLNSRIKINWRQEIFPLQWRIGVSWMSGYLIFQLFTPIVFSFHGAMEAGRLGMAIAIFNAVTNLGMSWVGAKAPLFTMLITRKELAEVKSIFKRCTLQAAIITGILGFIVYFAVCLLVFLDFDIANRVAAPSTLFWMALSSILNTLIFSGATYMRAHLEEPMLLQSLVGAIITTAAILITKEDITLMMMTIALLNTLVGLPWTFMLVKKYFNRK